MSSSKICMNGLCGVKTTQWKKGWAMKAGGFATLCYSCGNVYDQVNYCERFHLNEPGWRECKFCEKAIHCGCVVSKYLHECLDLGGISCIKCIIAKGTQALKPIQNHGNEIPNGFIPFSATWRPVIGNRMNGSASIDKGKLTQLTESIDKHQPIPSTSSLNHQFKQDETLGISSNKDIGTLFSNSSSLFNNGRTDFGFKSLYESKPQPTLNYSVATTKSSVDPSGPVEPEKVPLIKPCQRARLTFPKPSKSGVSKGIASDNRVARPPAEGRGRNQLLPRYWPKITDQELLQISGDLKSNCTITPLFEKVLSASDAGRIGRLVLPKACAEAYFPAINQSEGVPIRIQDIKGGEWTFQFRFWPNNNSRMYVLEGVTPCIQNMQMQAGDTVIFSRLDPGEKLVIGCRKATVSTDTQEGVTDVINGVTGGTGNMSTKNVEHEVMTNGDKKTLIHEKKKSRNIGLKNKRLHMHNEDVMELKITWEEAHELFRPSPTCKPTVSIIDNLEIEEYDEPPVFGKKTVFTVHASGSQEQWGQCDNCFKWRRLPTDVLLPPKWTCSDNVSDPDRASCSAPDETCTKDLERIFKFGKDLKKRKLGESKVFEEEEPSGLDALATVAALGDASTSVTTRHPRHRPGCSCIVCIQPPSGKGKHKPNCECNVCLTVKRRFKTLMLRKKKKLSDREAEMAAKMVALEDEIGIGIAIGDRNGIEMEVNGNGGQRLDLNCDPDKEDDVIMVDDNASGGEWGELTGVVPKGTSEIEGDSHPPVVGLPSPSMAPLTHTSIDESLNPVDDKAEKEMDDKVVEDY